MSNRVADMKKFAFDGGTWDGGSSANRDFIYNASGQIVASDTISRDDGLSGQQGRDAYLDALAFDPAIPDKPTITYSGQPGYPLDGLSFEASTFSDPQDPQGASTFKAMEWRVAEITPIGGGIVSFFDAGQDWKYLDDGTDQGTAWRGLAFDDASWTSSPAPFGFGGIGSPSIEFGTVTDRAPATYFRKTIEVPDPDLYETFTFKLHIDDGAVVFVNGVEVIRDGFDPATVVNFDTSADDSGNEGEFDEFSIPSEMFVAGTNLIAVELHQVSPGSSDAVFDLALEATERTIPAGSSLLFEWNATWESGELLTEQTQIAIPAAATREGRLYRARVRYKDDTDRWSNWSDPVEFTTSLPDIQPLLENLVISEFMYHPPAPNQAEIDAGYTDQDDFEFIELLNVSGSETLALNDVRFTKGIDFDFPAGTMLAPGSYLLVVRNRAAFELRYGAGLPIIGEYLDNAEANLSNSGERLKLSFAGGVPIRDLEYDDSSPWPEAADGLGSSLVLANPSSVPDHSLPANWIASSAIGGSPGAPGADALTLSSWLEQFGIFEPEPDPTLDREGDGLSQFLEFALAGDPTRSLPGERPQAGVIEIGGDDYLTITFRRPAAASGVSYAVEFSNDLNTWGADGIRLSTTPNPDNTVTEVWRSATAIAADAENFARVKVSQ